MLPKPKPWMCSAVLALTLAAGAPSAGGASPARWIVFSAAPANGSEGSEIFRIRTDGSGLKRITTRTGAVQPSFAPNGKRVAFRRTSGLYIMNLDGSGLRRVTRSSNDHFPVFSPDGERIAFVRGSRLQVMRLDGSRRRYLSRVPGSAGRPSWTPDGRSIVIGAGDDELDDFLYTVAVRSGRIQRKLFLESRLEAVNTVATLSPNGRTVAFIGRRLEPAGCQKDHDECEYVYAVYLKRASGGKSKRLIDGGGPVGWSSDSRTLVYRYGRGIRLHPLAGGATKTIAIPATLAFEGGPGGPPALQPR